MESGGPIEKCVGVGSMSPIAASTAAAPSTGGRSVEPLGSSGNAAITISSKSASTMWAAAATFTRGGTTLEIASDDAGERGHGHKMPCYGLAEP